MVLSYYQQKKVDVYIKHYSMISLQVRQIGLQWEVYYVIRYLDATRPIHMRIAICKSYQLAAVKISEIEDYIAGDMDRRKPTLRTTPVLEIDHIVPTLYGNYKAGNMYENQELTGRVYHVCFNGYIRKCSIEDCPDIGRHDAHIGT